MTFIDDTNAVSNDINKTYLCPDCKFHINHLNAPKFRAAKKLIKMRKGILLIGKMGPLQVRTWFGVVKSLAVDILFGTTHIECCIKGVIPMDRKIVPIYSPTIPVLTRDRDMSKIKGILSNKAFKLGEHEHAKIRYAKRLVVLETESPVIVLTSCNGLMTTERIQTDNPTNRCSCTWNI